ncbi:hypothetical protein [Nakamurella leprariae]|nr:hypothetical protein [Nakamurella leprariae]
MDDDGGDLRADARISCRHGLPQLGGLVLADGDIDGGVVEVQ